MLSDRYMILVVDKAQSKILLARVVEPWSHKEQHSFGLLRSQKASAPAPKRYTGYNT
jgi:hypothetical protein